MNNLAEFKELIHRYETITLHEIKIAFDKNYEYPETLKSRLTGFGRTNTCTLCVAVNEKCNRCVYGDEYGCLVDKTFDRIEIADTPMKLRNAYRARAKYMRTLIKMNDEDTDN